MLCFTIIVVTEVIVLTVVTVLTVVPVVTVVTVATLVTVVTLLSKKIVEANVWKFSLTIFWPKKVCDKKIV